MNGSTLLADLQGERGDAFLKRDWSLGHIDLLEVSLLHPLWIANFDAQNSGHVTTRVSAGGY